MFDWAYSFLCITASCLKIFCLCLQIQKVVVALGDYMEAKCHACIGGTNVKEDMMILDKGVHTVVGTPGRVFDMISRRHLGGYFYSSIILGPCLLAVTRIHAGLAYL